MAVINEPKPEVVVWREASNVKLPLSERAGILIGFVGMSWVMVAAVALLILRH
ncbi:MAG: hypothetical protein QM667_13570 [Asticcacaulis sp.]